MSGEADFTEFYSATFAPLTAQLHAFIGDHADAQDLVQEAYLRAYSRWSTVSQYDDPLAWVHRVAWNLAISRWRRKRVLRLWHRDLVQPPVEEPNATRVDLARALAQLPPGQRQAIILHYLADMPIADIAAFLDAPEGTVKARLHRARESLNSLLGMKAEVTDD